MTAAPPGLPAPIRNLSRGSNFEAAAYFLPGLEKRGMRVLYAFCRVVDDLADESPSPEAGRLGLEAWRKWLKGMEGAGSVPRPEGWESLAQELEWLRRCFAIEPALLEELLDGARSDLRPGVSFESEADLRRYCHQVAGAVGLACLPLFGVAIEQGREFAETLGLAFQLTNILRDARQDAEMGRLYFPREALLRFQVDEQAWMRGNPGPAGAALLGHYGEEAARCFDKAAGLRRLLKGNLKPADLMADVYGNLLKRMRLDGYRVFEKRYRVPGPVKLWFVLRRMAGF